MVPEVREEAARVLGASREPTARAVLLATATAATWAERAQLLACLRVPLAEQEVEALLAAIDESRQHLSIASGPDSALRWLRVRNLIAALPGPQRLEVLSQP